MGASLVLAQGRNTGPLSSDSSSRDGAWGIACPYHLQGCRYCGSSEKLGQMDLKSLAGEAPSLVGKAATEADNYCAQRPMIMSQELCLVIRAQREEAVGFCGGIRPSFVQGAFVKMVGIWIGGVGGGLSWRRAQHEQSYGGGGRLGGAVCLEHSRMRRGRGR